MDEQEKPIKPKKLNDQLLILVKGFIDYFEEIAEKEKEREDT